MAPDGLAVTVELIGGELVDGVADPVGGDVVVDLRGGHRSVAHQLPQDIEAGLAGHLYVEDDAGRRPRLGGGEKRCALAEAGHLVALARQHDGKGIQHQGIIVDDEDFLAGWIAYGH